MTDPILKSLGLTPQKVSELLGKHYTPMKKTPPTVYRLKGEMHHYSEVTKRRIYNLRMMGRTYAEISAMTGIRTRDAQLLFGYLKSTGVYAKEQSLPQQSVSSPVESAPLETQSSSQVQSVRP
jgi:hypothetical protein